jgi:hypothetical protein
MTPLSAPALTHEDQSRKRRDLDARRYILYVRRYQLQLQNHLLWRPTDDEEPFASRGHQCNSLGQRMSGEKFLAGERGLGIGRLLIKTDILFMTDSFLNGRARHRRRAAFTGRGSLRFQHPWNDAYNDGT